MTPTPTRDPMSQTPLCCWPRGILLSLLVALIAHAVATPAHADDATDRRANALTLFEEGRALAAAGKNEAACLKFEAAAKLAHSAGILLNLGDCYERLGRTASAWAVFRDAAGAAARSGRDIEEAEARRRQDALGSALPHLTVVIPTSHQLAGLRVARDGKPIAEGAWGVALPVDPGDHVVEVSAPGYRTWGQTVRTETGSSSRVTVPLLEHVVPNKPAPKTPAAPPPDEEAHGAKKSRRVRRIVAGVLGGVGLAGIGGGVYLGFRAKDDFDEAKARCDAENVCDSSDARRLGQFATVATAIGAASLATGAVLYFTTRSPKRERGPEVRVQAEARADGPGLVLKGAF